MSARTRKAAYLFALTISLVLRAFAQQTASPVAWWKFDEGTGSKVRDSAGGFDDQILNYYDWVKGASGMALKFDGFTTVIERPAKDAPRLREGFTISAWIALQSYPWNWVALVDQDKDQDAGYFFGVDAEGRLGLQLSVWGNWEICRSDIRIPLTRWVYVVGVYDPVSGIHLYIDGKATGTLPLVGNFTPANDTPLRIGRNLQDLPPIALVRKKASFPAKYSLDGIVNDLKIYDRSLTPVEVSAGYKPGIADISPELSARRWPELPGGATHLNAAYTSLKLYPEWDRLWRTGPYPDVVVSFGERPFHYVFWRGTNFGPAMVTENGIWMSDQSFESSTKVGTAEHMNDKHNMHASISIVENSDARVVLHWRYALVDVLGNIADVDPDTGWGDWADEYFYIYPDGLAVRHGIIHGTRRKYSFTEPTLLLEPGQKPEDYISLEAATIANAAGATRTYSWNTVSPPFPFPEQPTDANVALVNLKSKYRPFYIYKQGTVLGPYGWPPELRPRYSHFPVWDHWPVNQIPSDGRFALYPDHFASSAIMSPNPNATWVEGPGSTKSTYFLFGLTDGTIADLARLDQSWLHPPAVQMSGEFTAVYDPAQRAYLIKPTWQIAPKKPRITFLLEGSENSPIVNPAFVISNWGESSPVVRVNGTLLKKEDLRVGFQRRLEATDLVLWLTRISTAPTTVNVTSAK